MQEKARIINLETTNAHYFKVHMEGYHFIKKRMLFFL